MHVAAASLSYFAVREGFAIPQQDSAVLSAFFQCIG
jgi:hypothetical protein